MKQPRFSVVVPTRGRPATLPFTVRTCLQQSYSNYEVVVCDNDVSSDTRKIVDDLACNNLRYVRAPESLAMSDNWNLALAHTTGDYLIYLGDDDGLMPNALTHLAALLEHTPTQALTWRPIAYSWPSFVIPEEANFMVLPLTREITSVDSRSRIKDILGRRGNFAELPNIYHGMIHRDLIEKARLPDGRVFTGACPDTVTSIAFAYLAGTFLSVTVPFSIAGYSAASNHMAWRLLHNNHPSANDSRTLNAKAGYHLHPWVPDLPITASVLADSFLRAKENHFPDDDSMVLDRRLMTEWYLSALPFAELERRQHCFARIRAALADSSELLAWFDSLDLTRFMPAAPRMFRRETPAFDGQFLTVDLSAFGIHDVVAAAKLSADLLRWPVKEVPFDLPCFAERAHFLSQKYTELDALYLNGGLKSFVQVVLKRLVGKLVEKLFPWRRAA